jgi:2-iminobutanoate/2-iminopropanoate deaminase
VGDYFLKTIETVSTPKAPTPFGHYAQATRAGGLVHVSGQLPVVPGEKPDSQAPFEVQAKQVIDNFLAILAAAGCGPQDVVKFTAYIVGSENWPIYDRVFAAAFGEHKPARTGLPVSELHYGLLIEIDGVALDPAASAQT